MPSEAPIRFLQSALPPLVEGAFVLVTHAGSGPAYGSVIAAWALGWDRREGYVLAAVLAASAGLNSLLKAAFAWPRPPEGLHRVSADGFGFPSGHAQANGAFWGALAGLRRTRRVAVLGVVAVFLVALSRVVLGVHYPRDVAAGAAVGVAVAAAGFGAARLLDEEASRLGPAGRGSVAVLAPLPLAWTGIQGWAPAAAGALSGFGAAYVAEGHLRRDRPAGLVPLAAGLVAAVPVAVAGLLLPRTPPVDGTVAFLAVAAALLVGPEVARRRRGRGPGW